MRCRILDSLMFYRILKNKDSSDTSCKDIIIMMILLNKRSLLYIPLD